VAAVGLKDGLYVNTVGDCEGGGVGGARVGALVGLFVALVGLVVGEKDSPDLVGPIEGE
jgi:hypothetical protein